ncbi:MAG: GAF domain-containing protein [Fimbriimonas sp.]
MAFQERTAPASGTTDPATLLMELAAQVSSEDELIHELVWELKSLAQVDSCDILYRDSGEGLVLRASTVVPELDNRLKLGKGVGLCGHCLLTNEPIFIPHAAKTHPKYAKYPGVDDHEPDALVVIPLQDGQGSSFGVVLFRRQVSWRITSRERNRLTLLTHATSAALRTFSSAYKAGAKTNRLGALNEVTKTISSSPYLEEILQLLVHLTAQQFNYRVCTVRLLDENRGELVLRATQAPAKAYQRKRAIKLGESIAGRAIAENRPIIVRDVQIEAEYIGHDLAAEQGLRSMICVPLMLSDRPLGVLSCYTSEVRDFLSDEIKALETLAKQAAVSIQNAKLQVRDTLMQEMHHRVKNNLQQVASLLRLQSRAKTYKSLEEALNDTLSRILAIAAVHDLLSRDDLDHVGIRSIAESLVQAHQGSLLLPNRTIQFQVRGEDVTLGMNQATQVALVLNELIQNAIEHGFKVTERGEIHVNIEELETDVSVWVSNSGDQLPPGFDMSKSSNLGLSIVDSLCRSMGGKFRMQEVMGWTVCEVKFPRVGGE